MKKAIIFLVGFITTVLTATSLVYAQPDINSLTTDVAKQGGYQTTGVTGTTLSETVGKIIRVLLSLVGTIFLALMIYAGFLWMTAAGDEGKIEKSLDIIKASVIGLTLVIAGYGLTTFVVGVLTSSTGVPGSKVGTGTSMGFWESFGKSFKDNWWSYLF